MKKNYFSLLIALLSIFTKGQVGINTDDPTTTLQIIGKSPSTKVEGVLIPKFTGDQIFNMPISVAQGFTTISAANEANLVYATAAAAVANQTGRGEFLKEPGFFYWDDTLQKWRKFFVATSSTSGNDGVVKVNSGAGNAKPTYNLSASGSSYGTNQQVLYTTPLIFAASPVTSWPETTVPFPGVTSNIYIGTTAATQRWRENDVQGQVHVWRMIAKVTPGSNSGGSLRATLRNPDSGFIVTSVQLIPNGSSGVGNTLTFYFYTIADPASLDPNRGYQLFVQADLSCTVEVDSFTRISLFKD